MLFIIVSCAMSNNENNVVARNLLISSGTVVVSKGTNNFENIIASCY
jgi:hypothetical protein